MNETTSIQTKSDPHPSDPATSDLKIAAVGRLYAAFARGEIEGVLTELADDVDWAAEASSRSVPWYGQFSGKAEVPKFFAAIGSNVDVTAFETVSFTSSPTDVVATIRWAYTVKRNGRRVEMFMQHWWRFTNGKISYFRGSEDTEQSARAFS